jgi:mannose-6-phosphate isomerase-like protein (cupin superfamily)
VDSVAVPYVLAAGQERSHPGTWPAIKAGAADTGGAMTAVEDTLAPWASGPPLHAHDSTDECLYVAAGQLLVQIGQERHRLEAGSFAWVPRRTPHTFANAGAVPARVFGVTVPGGIEEFFAARSAYLASVQGPPDGAELARLAAGWGRTLGPAISAPAEPQSPTDLQENPTPLGGGPDCRNTPAQRA